MESLLLLGFVVAAVLFLVAVMGMLRFNRRPGSPTFWLPLAGLVVSGTLFVVSMLMASWLNATVFALNAAVFSMLLGMSRSRSST